MFEQLNPLAFSALVSAFAGIPEDPGVTNFEIWIMGLCVFGLVFLFILLAYVLAKGLRE